MTIEPFCAGDIPDFLAMAAGENWVAEEWEFTFLLKSFAEGCFTMRDRDGRGIGFVTSLRHGTSGWIGNLIVAEECRGQGIGEALFRKAQEALQSAGADTFWLTASSSGRSLYEKYGFQSLDTIVRWSGTGCKQRDGSPRHLNRGGSSSSVSSIDRQVWGDRRDALLAVTTGRGQLLLEESGFLVIQPSGSDLQLGPFSALDGRSAEYLCNAALEVISHDVTVYIDAPLSNRSASRVYSQRSLRICGSNELMYAGIKPDYQPDFLYGLATMGSCG